MEKLIKLLDLYRRENKTEELFGEPGTLVPLTGKDFIMLNRVIIISKEYGFIKWLVENDKIDRYKCGLKKEGFRNWYDKGIALVENYDNDTYKVTEFYRPYFQLLMLLSIQDKPIEFLISILK